VPAPTPSGIITLLTDFGDSDGYVGQMKGVILTIFPRARIVDVTHRIAPQAVLQAALVLRDTAPHFPDGTIHVAVVDPGVGSSRRAVVARTAKGWFIGPDNGLLGPAAAEAAGAAGPGAEPVPGAVEWFQLSNPRYQQALVSPTFHGRDIFAPAAAHIAAGVPVEELGEPVPEPVKLVVPEARARADGSEVNGEVLRADRYGNLVTNIGGGHLLRLGVAHVIVEIAGQVLHGVAESYASAVNGELVCVVGSSGCLEIAEAGGSAASRLGVGPGAAVTVRRA
jgi:S-adenosylmethionine hydrolase